MQITVLLKLVSQSTFTDSIDLEPKDRLASGQLVVNPADEYALEQALRLRDRIPGTQVAVVTMAPACAEHLLFQALAMGADMAIHVCDSVFAGSDTLVTARVLAEAVAKLPPQDLIMCGQRAIDSETGHIGAQLAACMGWPVITNTVSFQCDEEGEIRLTRLQDDGMVDISCGKGVVVTVCRGTDMVRVPSILGMRRARNAPIMRLDRTQLTIPAEEAGASGSPTRVIRAAKVRYGNRNGGGTEDVTQGVAAVLGLMEKELGKHE